MEKGISRNRKSERLDVVVVMGVKIFFQFLTNGIEERRVFWPRFHSHLLIK